MKLINKSFFVTHWPYWVGGIFLGIINILFFLLSGKPLGVIYMFHFLGLAFLEILYSILDKNYLVEVENYVYLITVINLGVIFGSFLSVFEARQFSCKGPKHFNQFFSSLGGGFLMGYGATIAGGCNIGAMFNGISSFSLHGWIFTLFMLLGVYIGGRLIKLLI